MTKLIITILTLITISLNVNSQIFEKNKNFIQIGSGVSSLELKFLEPSGYYPAYKTNSVYPLFLKYEYALNNFLGIGINIAYINLKATYTYKNFIVGNGEEYKEYLTYNSYSILARINFHFVKSNISDMYIGIGVGKRGAYWKITDNEPTDNNKYRGINITKIYPIGYELTIGSRFMFTKHIGAYIEAGFAKTIAQIGIVIKP